MAFSPSRWLSGLSLGTLLSLFTACTTTPNPPPPSPVVVTPKIGLALGGGAARGFAHIGVLKMLSSQGIRPDYIAGTSAGAVVGSLYASGMDIFALQKIGAELDEKVFADWGLPSLGLLSGESLEKFINQHLHNRPLEKLPIPFTAVAADLQTGDIKMFRRGDTGQAVRASASVPGIFKPAIIQGRSFVDGGLVSPVPVEAVRAMGADIVIAVDISTRPMHQPIDSITGILWQTVSIMGERLADREIKTADFLIRPSLPYVKSWDFGARNQAMIEGERAAIAVIPAIQAKIAEFKNKQMLTQSTNKRADNVITITPPKK